MMSNNKILTVSYGTFSCTLEGFDDSFGTMKAIAEYFRDLSSEDRYFGAEPAQPDAEMLAKIAQKGISRRVEAREHDGKIVLSATQEQTVPALLAGTAGVASVAAHAAPKFDAPAQEAPKVEQATHAPLKEQVVQFASQDEEVAPPETAIETEIAEHAPIEAETETETAAHQIEEHTGAQAVEQTFAEIETPGPIATDENTASSETILDGIEEDAELVSADDASFAVTRRAEAAAPQTLEMDGSEHDIVPGTPDAEVSSFFAQSVTPADLDVDFTENADIGTPNTFEDAEVFEAPVAPIVIKANRESIADKLQRIRDVVAQNDIDEFDVEADEIDPVDQPASDEALTTDVEEQDPVENAVILAALRDIKGPLATDDEAQEQAEIRAEEYDEDVSDDDDISNILSRLQQDNDAESMQELVEQDALQQDEPVDPMHGDFEEEASDNIFVAAEFEDVQAEPADDLPTAEVVAEAEETPKVPRARVIKVKRVALQAAIDTGELEEIHETTAAQAQAASSLNDAQEAELAEELAALESDLDDVESTIQDDTFVDDSMADEAIEQVAAQKSTAAREILPAIDEGQNPDMNRLMDETDQQMDEPENATRRNAFAHLRAAVAAKKADFAMGGRDDTETEGDAYRDDLAEVVRPRRPVGAAQRTPRPNSARPAPLKLVAEQRIDEGAPTGGVPVRPRRVAAVSDEVVSQTETGFAEFAAEMGAVKLPDLLEAAAAYMSFVEGRDQFSRPQLMHRVRQVEQEEFSREDGLRWFGKLLRDGKIEKITGGQFQVSEQIGFKPDERAVG